MFDGSVIQERDLCRVPSVRRNPVLADMFERLDYMEQRGSGFQKMLDSVKDAKNLQVYSDPTTFVVIFKNMNYNNEELKKLIKIKNNELLNEPLNELLNEPLNLTEIEDRILKLIQQNSKIKKEEMSDILNVSLSTVKRNIDALKDKRFLERKGSKRTGYWEIIEK
ncbi:MAG: winged helix-turn-helix transcriptional regulator [Oscillospiraceae bacterium]|nr:winged helix-turn-helix transcriptional regulator [Oscillospiraceae bacterium]